MKTGTKNGCGVIAFRGKADLRDESELVVGMELSHRFVPVACCLRSAQALWPTHRDPSPAAFISRS